MTRPVNQATIDLVKSFEQFQGEAYLPTPDDVPTIGWGHTKGVQMGDTCDEAQGEAFIQADLAEAAAEVEADATVDLSDDEFGACVSLAFNIGRSAFRGSTLLKLLNADDHADAAQQFLRWNKQAGVELKGLDRRRAAEAALFQTPDAVA